MNTTFIEKGSRELRRAPRYSVVAPLRFRSGQGAWIDGTTVNIGRLGVLVRTERPSASPTRLEMRIDLTTNRTIAGSLVLCWGRVVRTEPSAEGDTLMAVTIDDFHLEPAIRDD